MIEHSRQEALMAIEPPKIDPLAQKAVAPDDRNQGAAGDRRIVRTADLSEEEIAAVEASEIEPGFEHLNAELDEPGPSLIDLGLDFARRLSARRLTAEGRPADKAFRDGLYDDT
jgi:antitoxin VapB